MPNKKKKETKKDIRILLDNIRSAYNVGSIFRTAEALGISKIYCLNTTPTPIDRFGRIRGDIAKVALGAEKLVEWGHVKGGVNLVKDLKRQKFQIISLEQATNSLDYKKVKIHSKALVILGNEVGGVSKKLLKSSDIIAEIPLNGRKESLNVSVAAGVFLFRILN
ncbi:MAG: TrmH family RNA methyltransferase [Patescibacteria group bacterium]